MVTKCSKYPKGVTLIEIISAMVILSVIVLGLSAHRYYAAMDARKASSRTTAVTTASLLCETWRGLDGASGFNPNDHFNSELSITESGNGPDVPAGFTELDRYRVTIDDVYYWTTLSWKDISTNLRALNIVVMWNPRASKMQMYSDSDKSYKLTAYVTY